jgi:5-methylcytosine-specific restriction endonuclease McrA
MSGALSKINEGEIPHNIRDVFHNVNGIKESIGSDIKAHLKRLDCLTTEYSAIQKAWLTARQAYGDYLWKSYPERRKRANYAISKEELRIMVFTRDEYQCKNCQSGERLEVDHIISVLNGGTDGPENLQTLCCQCNRRKGAK